MSYYRHILVALPRTLSRTDPIQSVFFQALEQCMMGTVVAQEELAVFGCFRCFFYTSCWSFDPFEDGDSKRKGGWGKKRKNTFTKSENHPNSQELYYHKILERKKTSLEKKIPRRIHHDLLKFQHNGAFYFLSVFIPPFFFSLSWTRMQLLVTDQRIWLMSDSAHLDSYVLLLFPGSLI